MVRTATEMVREDVSERSLLSASPVGALPAVAMSTISIGRIDSGTETAGRLRMLPASRLAFDLHWAVRVALSAEVDRGTPFLFLPVLLTGGSVAYFTASGEPAWLSLVLGAVVLAVLALLSRSRRPLRIACVVALTILLGVLAAKVESWRAGTRVLGAEISTRLTGRIVEMEHLANGRVRLTLDVIATERPVLRYAPERVRVSARTVPAGVISGTTVSGFVRLRPPTGPVRPGSYDFSFESYFEGIGASGFFLSGPDRVEAPAPPTLSGRISAAVENARATLAARIRDRIGGVEGEIAAALVVGVRAGIPETVNEAMRRTGLAHILSISGLHMALVAATIMAALRGGLALFPDFSSRRPVKKYAAFIALVAIAAYLFISGSEVAAERSFIMLAVMLTAVLFDRAALSMRNLAIAAIIVVAWSPHEAVGPSFQMSFAATAALIGAYSAWSDRKRRRARPQPGPFVFRVAQKALHHATGLAMTSLIAGAATALYGAYHFQRVSPLSLGANLATMPAVSGIVMPFAVMGMVAMPFGLDGPFFDVMGKGITVMIAVAEWFSERSPLDAVGIVPPAALMVLTVALVISTLLTTWLRVAAVPLLALGMVLIAGRQTPDVLISEDGRVVALRLDDGRLAVDRARPSSFAIENWRRALQTGLIELPKSQPFSGLDSAADETPFYCDDGLCIAINSDGMAVAHADRAVTAKKVCAIASVIIIDDAAARNPCTGHAATVITRRDLARHGSAEVFFGKGASDVTVNFAVAEPYRPWHAQRRFSREARGLPPYRREKQTRQAKEID